MRSESGTQAVASSAAGALMLNESTISLKMKGTCENAHASVQKVGRSSAASALRSQEAYRYRDELGADKQAQRRNDTCFVCECVWSTWPDVCAKASDHLRLADAGLAGFLYRLAVRDLGCVTGPMRLRFMLDCGFRSAAAQKRRRARMQPKSAEGAVHCKTTCKLQTGQFGASPLGEFASC